MDADVPELIDTDVHFKNGCPSCLVGYLKEMGLIAERSSACSTLGLDWVYYIKVVGMEAEGFYLFGANGMMEKEEALVRIENVIGFIGGSHG